MAESSKLDPAAGWRKRVFEAQQDLQFVEEEYRQLQADVNSVERMIVKEKEAVRQEKIKLAKRLEETERIGNELETQCQQQSVAKQEVERVYQQALDEYDRLHDVVKLVKAKERECDQRTDYDRMLQTESYAWAEEEHGLRTSINEAQAQLKDARQKHQDEIANAEARLRDAESRLHSDRMSREPPRRSDMASRQPSLAARSQQRSGAGSIARGASATATMPTNENLVPVPQPILISKGSVSRKRDQFGDVTNQ